MAGFFDLDYYIMVFTNLSQWKNFLSEEVKCLFSSSNGHFFSSFCAFKTTLKKIVILVTS